MNPDSLTYHHIQRAPWYVLFYVLFVIFCAVGWTARHDPVVSVVMPAVGLLMLVVIPCFHHLTVADKGDHLEICFGPLPLFRKRIMYENIRQVEIGRTMLLEGWGIHMSLRGGMVWNIWGRDCVVVYHRGITRIGTDDGQNLARFLKSKMSAHAGST